MPAIDQLVGLPETDTGFLHIDFQYRKRAPETGPSVTILSLRELESALRCPVLYAIILAASNIKHNILVWCPSVRPSVPSFSNLSRARGAYSTWLTRGRTRRGQRAYEEGHTSYWRGLTCINNACLCCVQANASGHVTTCGDVISQCAPVRYIRVGGSPATCPVDRNSLNGR